MSSQEPPSKPESQPVTLVVRRLIHAPVERVFEAWTQSARLKEWWGPEGVRCVDAEIDLRAGGRYRIANRFADGKVMWIVGEFELVAPPHKLVYTWGPGQDSTPSERVTVRFEPRGDATEVTIVHERIVDKATRDMHEQGWRGCLDGLADYFARASSGGD